MSKFEQVLIVARFLNTGAVVTVGHCSIHWMRQLIAAESDTKFDLPLYTGRSGQHGARVVWTGCRH